MSLPFYYQQMNLIMGTKVPGEIEYNSEAYWYFWRSLYQRLRSRFACRVPKSWDREQFMFMLLGNGFMPIVDTNKYTKRIEQKYGIIPLYGTLKGIGVQYQPTSCIISNPIVRVNNGRPLRFWKECGLIKLTPDYCGVFDIINQYAKKLSTLDSTINQSIINARFSYVMAAKNPAGAQTLKAIMDERNKGNPYIVYDKDLVNKQDADKADFMKSDEMFEFVDFKVKENYITKDLLNDLEMIYHQFDQEVGIPSNPLEKKERMISNEVESNNVESVARFTTWMECIDESQKKTKEFFKGEIDDLYIGPMVYDTGQTGSVESGKVVKLNASKINATGAD